MSNIIKTYISPIILLGAGDVNWPLLQHYADKGCPVVAADGGANLLMGKDIFPDLIIGDLDSLELSRIQNDQTTVHRIEEQDTTDFEKCLYAADAPRYVGFGFLGNRLDHSLAALHVLAKYCDHKTVLLIDQIDTVLVTRRAVTLELPVDSRVSIFPLGQVHFERSTGLAYPLDNLELEIGQRSGTSNKSVSTSVHIQPSAKSEAAYAVIVGSENHLCLPPG